jgi:hypothetical protein
MKDERKNALFAGHGDGDSNFVNRALKAAQRQVQ